MVNMYEINQIMRDCADGIITSNEANEKLDKLGVTGIRYDSDVNVITDEEMNNTTVSEDFSVVNGYMLLDTGTGYKNKVKVENNTLVNCDIGNMYGIAMIGDLMWEVMGNKIVGFKGARTKK